MSDTNIKIWDTCGYVRLSREDGDKEESNSVTGQKDLIRDFLSRHPELRECDMKVDDGYTGSNFDRPAFQKMMEAVKFKGADKDSTGAEPDPDRQVHNITLYGLTVMDTDFPTYAPNVDRNARQDTLDRRRFLC